MNSVHYMSGEVTYSAFNELPKARRHASVMLSMPSVRAVTTTKIASPNQPCPCNSGKKFKRCHGLRKATAGVV